MFIAGDWGTSQLRLYLCEYQESAPLTIVANKLGLGISKIDQDFEDVLFDLCDEWLSQYGQMPVLLSGMVGSTIGWHDAGYLDCPLPIDNIVDGRTQFTARGLDISILSGLRTENILGSPDVMRGEELQLLGWKHLTKQTEPTQLIALPGTHNKWAVVKNGVIDTFLTALTGELFAVLKKHSVLISKTTDVNIDEDTFMEGVQTTENLSDSHLLHALFSTRSRQVVGGYSESDGLSYLSGLLIGSDINGALKLFAEQFPEINSITLIGEDSLCHYYQLALKGHNITANIVDSQQIASAGYAAVYQKLYLER